MTYVSWAALYEGASDQAYFDLLIPRAMESIIALRGTRNSTISPSPAVRFQRGPAGAVAKKICSASDAFHLIFIHSDTGGRALQTEMDHRSTRYCESIHTLCDWPVVRCISISPRHETEAWVIADPGAVTAALGYRGSPESIGLPITALQAERLVDPKHALEAAVMQVRGRRRPYDAKQIFPAIAQRQSIAILRETKSFSAFETTLSAALTDLGCI